MTDVHVPPDEAIETFTCAVCDDVWNTNDRHPIYDEMCEPCGEDHFTCDWCGSVTNVNYMNTCDSPHAIICESCCSTGTRWCPDCNTTYDTDHWSSCPNDCDRGDDDQLYGYGFKPYPVFHDVHDTDVPPQRGTVYMGVELEMEATSGATPNEGVNIITRHLGAFAYCKEDGSLQYGLEMVTHPMTLEYAQTRDWSVLSVLRTNGFRSWDTQTAGMHIHVSRTAFDGPSHLYRFTQLVLKNEPACTTFAGRKNDTYASFRDGYQPGFLAKVIKGRDYGSRGAVNLQNGATVEVRMFRGSLKKQRLLANLEFVHAAVEYTRMLTVPEVATGALSWRAFATWITDNRTTYPHLFASLSLDPNTTTGTVGA
jgi:hypothetical protein